MLFKVKLPVIAENCPACFEAPKVSNFAFVAFLFVFMFNFCCISFYSGASSNKAASGGSGNIVSRPLSQPAHGHETFDGSRSSGPGV